MSAENWHEERDRLVKLVDAIEAGDVTYVDEDGLQQLQATSAANVALLKKRLATLNDRIGDGGGLPSAYQAEETGGVS